MSRATGLAAVMTAPRTTELREVPLPEIGPDAGLLRVVASGICGSDWGKYTSDKFVPSILGHEIVGYVEKLGPIARARWGVEEGDYVALEEYLPCGHCDYCRNGEYRSCLETDQHNPNGVRYGSTKFSVSPGLYGGYSQFLYLHPRTVLHRLPSHIPPHIAAMALPLGNGFQWTFLDAGIGPGKTLVVLGPGQQGCGCVVAAKTAGAENIVVVGLARDEHRFEIAKRLGATHTIAIDTEDARARVRDITGGEMADVVIEVSSAGPEIVNAGLSLLRKRGRMLCTAMKKILAVPLDLDRLIRFQIGLRGVRGHSYQAVELAIRAMNSDQHRLDLISTHVLGLDDVDHALRLVGGEAQDSSTNGVQSTPGAIHITIEPWKKQEKQRMLTAEENERVTRVGPGTPLGKLFRRYWWPVCLSKELPERDGAPIRVRLLGEDLIAFRDSENKIGLFDAFCPHRRAPLFFGRNEECGLRCVYHGWKFDRRGDCVDMPSEPAGTTLQAKVKILAYPTVEKGGVIWAYLGPKELMPEEPDYEWTRAPATHRYVSKTFENCNYLQALEGGLDTSHSSFAHNNKLGDRSNLRQHDRAPNIEVERTDYGYFYVSQRNVDAGKYVRVYHYVMPAQQLRASIIGYEGVRNNPARLDGHIWTPIDDYTTHIYNIMCAPHPEDELTPEAVETREKAAGRGREDHIPGTFRLKRNQSNDYMIDRKMQKTQNFTGIVGVNTQDFALQEGMGPICDRSKEFLGTSDKAIVGMRRLLLEAIAVNEKGGIPRALDPKTYRTVRAYDRVIPANSDWHTAMEKDLVALW